MFCWREVGVFGNFFKYVKIDLLPEESQINK